MLRLIVIFAPRGAGSRARPRHSAKGRKTIMISRNKLAAWSAMAVLLGAGAAALAQPAANDLSANPFANDPAAPAAGQALFNGACAACHGTGAGGSERAPALNSGVFQHGGSDNDLFQTIRAGVP